MNLMSGPMGYVFLVAVGMIHVLIGSISKTLARWREKRDARRDAEIAALPHSDAPEPKFSWLLDEDDCQ